ncbi:PEP-CTERM sorting domain-containing protein [Cerasicoccus arenae]|uniref:PEP-CTERM protein-sorting domain-containing protein n=1 Tax=Cerasicoccus arenae TaxID=424488 RepID=A0A8J3DE96_9BACT|nr:PEP-CTERM sorting domain-containing protein [Cerasicoccus arenae]MBK1858382.1 PEP-CTERM sorting domain-containing protein [Cerasicoccus arenae]GHC09923.1 hypothetical protein GCM10007047_29110 [Cerasicoccus arenae]
MKNMLKLPIVCSIIFVAQAAIAETVVDVSPTAPDTNIEASFTSGTASGYQWRDNENSRRDLGQSFLADSSFTLDAFSFSALGNVQAGASGASFDVKIFESDNISLIGSAISTQSGTYLTSGSNPVSGNWIVFDLEDVALTAGNYYTIVLSWDSAGVQDQDQVFGMVSGNLYGDGSAWESSDGVNFSSLGGDLQFTVQSIPEPSTVALFLGVVAISVVARQRRNRK